MDFLNHGREIFRQALAQAIEHHIPEAIRLPLGLALLLIGARYAINPRLRFWAGFGQRFLSRENFFLYLRCVGVLLMIAGGVLLQFG